MERGLLTSESRAPLPACLSDLCAELDRFRDPIPPGVLRSGLLAVDPDVDSLSTRLHFDSHAYCRNLLHRGPTYEALLVCWRPGQASPIHDHGGSSCAFRIVHGVGSESVFTLDAHCLRPLEERTHAMGTVTCSRDEEIHELANRQAFDLVTIHLYSPALDRLRTYGRVPRTESKAAAWR